MEKIILSNKIKLIYEYREGSITSFCIGLNAGALEESSFNYGIAHAVEHMVFKGTETRSEDEINRDLDRLFGFNNAMTNYPYVIYYGTTLSKDFKEGFSLYSDIVLKPAFKEEGFKEEIAVILEELREWKDDSKQYCEDLLFYNAFKERRIKELIIGSKLSVSSITLEEIKKFYNRYYQPENTVVSVVSSLSLEEVLATVEENMGGWDNSFKGIEKTLYEKNTPGVFFNEIQNNNGAKIMYSFNIDDLDEDEIYLLEVFNLTFGEGVSSLLFDEIRTKTGLAYEVYSEIKIERGIKLFIIYISTSKEKVQEAINITDRLVKSLTKGEYIFNNDKIEADIKRLKLKKELSLERSIELAKKLTTYELMFGDGRLVYKFSRESKVSMNKFQQVINKILKEPTIQIFVS